MASIPFDQIFKLTCEGLSAQVHRMDFASSTDGIGFKSFVEEIGVEKAAAFAAIVGWDYRPSLDVFWDLFDRNIRESEAYKKIQSEMIR